MRKQHNNSARASALQIALSITLTSISVALLLAMGLVGTMSRSLQAQTAEDGPGDVAIRCAAGSTWPKVYIDGLGPPGFVNFGRVDAISPGARTVPHWTSSFTFAGSLYPFTMIGTDPATSNASTVVPVAIIPIKFVFADGNSLDGGGKLADIFGSGNTLGSPNFQNAAYTTGLTQYADAVQRAQFWRYVSTTSPDWHTLLGKPTIYPTQVISVPRNHGSVCVVDDSGTLLGVIDVSWFYNKILNAINQLHIPPTTLAIVQTYNTYADFGTVIATGFHSATSLAPDKNGNQQVQTFIFAAWTDPGIYYDDYIADISPLSHEIAEWMNDPFLSNAVPPWQYPGFPETCQMNLEVADPVGALLSAPFPVTVRGYTYHPHTDALLQWFSRESPSSAIDGAYSYPNTSILDSPSQPCQ